MSQREIEARRQRLEALRAQGLEPYPARVGPRRRIAELRAAFDDRDADSLERDPQTLAVAGRVLGRRSFGKLLFLDLLEDGARLQVSARKNQIDAELFRFIGEVDVGDFVRVEGPLWRTRAGELTLDARGLELLAKSLRPLPEKWHGLVDVEARYRQRYLDLLSNPETRDAASLRRRAVSAVRAFLEGRGFLEVETPVLQPVYGGASAQPFTTHHNAYHQKLYLRVADELYLKRLVIGGLDRVYEIGHNFRNEGVSRKHSPEFTMMECYQAYADYRDMMDLSRELVQFVAERTVGRTRLEYQGQEIELGGSWPHIGMRDAILAATQIDVLAVPDLAALRGAMAKAGLAPGDAPTWGALVDDLFSQSVEPGLVQPTFVVDYPRELSPLAKGSPSDPRLVERFELFMAGMEVANAFSELNDPDDQRGRFEEQQRSRAAGDEEAHPMDEDYLRALEYGMPPTGGLGVGLDRLIMLLTDAPTLRETVLFPHLRPESE